MFYRRKILLSLIESFGGQLQNTDLQKLLFVFASKQKIKSYHFVPYKFGSFSFQSVADKSALIKYGYLSENEKWKTTSKSKNISSQLKSEDKQILNQIKSAFNTKLGRELVRYVYLNDPYYAIRSEIVNEILTTSERYSVDQKKPNDNTPAFFTIGYEGVSLEEYLNKLIRENVKVLCDVRKNALSQKFGFSKNQLSNACKGVGLTYIHIPDLGIPSENRQKLESQNDYEILFDYYEKNILTKQKDNLSNLLNLVNQYGRVAITCFEACEKQCHRGRVAKAVKNLPGWNIPIKHI